MTAPDSRAGKLLGGDSFSFAEAIGGWRGFIESVVPGLVYVTVFLITKTWQAPVIASLGVVAVMVAIRLVQKGQLTQAFSGVIGVVIGAIWAWRTGSATGYFAPKLWTNGLFLAGMFISMAVRWPIAGVVMGLVHGTGNAWRSNPAWMKRAQWGTLVLAAMFALRLAFQMPLYLADNTAVLGTVNLAMGTPLFALTLWVVWLLVRNVGRKQEPQDQPQQT